MCVSELGPTFPPLSCPASGDLPGEARHGSGPVEDGLGGGGKMWALVGSSSTTPAHP